MVDKNSADTNAPIGLDSHQTEPISERQPDSGRISERRHTSVVALAAGLVGIIGTAVGSWIQIDGASRSQAAQFAEQRATDERTTRADIYFAFLDAANKYSVSTENVRDCIVKARDAASAAGAHNYSLNGMCAKYASDLASDRFDFQGARNKVYVYGSVAAEREAGLIAGYLPIAIDGDPATGLPYIDNRLLNFDQVKFDGMYQDFQATVCREVPAEPRTSC